MEMEKLDKYDVVGGVLVILLGVVNGIFSFLAGESNLQGADLWAYVIFFAVFGILLLVGGVVFLAVAGRGTVKRKKRLIKFLIFWDGMSAITMILFLIYGGVGSGLLGLGIGSIILCLAIIFCLGNP